MKELINVVADRVLVYMERQNLTQYKLSQLSNIPFSTIKNIMQRRSKGISFKTIILLAKGLGITPSQFIDCDEFLAENIDWDKR